MEVPSALYAANGIRPHRGCVYSSLRRRALDDNAVRRHSARAVALWNLRAGVKFSHFSFGGHLHSTYAPSIRVYSYESLHNTYSAGL